jgi:hypothetical protein
MGGPGSKSCASHGRRGLSLFFFRFLRFLNNSLGKLAGSAAKFKVFLPQAGDLGPIWMYALTSMEGIEQKYGAVLI